MNTQDTYFVKQGSCYNPGYEVVERASERHLIVLGTFEKKADAEDFCAYMEKAA